jgi:hypothetical protein
MSSYPCSYIECGALTPDSQTSIPLVANTTVTDTGGVCIVESIAFPDVNSLIVFSWLNISGPSAASNFSRPSLDISQHIEESISRWAAGGGGVSAEALETVLKAQVQGIVDHTGLLFHSASKTRRRRGVPC